jgi:nucleotide-binding universal stress UspA family protein
MYVAPNSVDVRSSGKATYVPNETIVVGDKFDRAVKIMEDKKVAYETVANLGNPAHLIINRADSKYDLVVVGKRGINGIEEFLMGSVSSQIAHHSKVPVLIVP